MPDGYVQVGTFAHRNNDGTFLPSVPLFIRSADAGGTNPQTGLTTAEEVAMTDISKIFADKFRQYKMGVRAAENKLKYQKSRIPENQ